MRWVPLPTLTSRRVGADRLLQRAEKVHAFAPGFQVGNARFGVSLAGVIERLDRTSADVANRPDDSRIRGPAMGLLRRGFSAFVFGVLREGGSLGKPRASAASASALNA